MKMGIQINPSSPPDPAPVPEPGPESQPDLSTFPSYLKGKRILLCTESFGPVNGVSRTTLMLVNHLRANGATVAVVAPHNHTGQNTFLPNVSQDKQHSNNISNAAESEMTVRIQGYPLPYNPELSIVYPVRLSQVYARTFGDSPDSRPDLIYLASPASLGFQVMLQLRQQQARDQIPIIANFQTDLSGYCEILFPQPLSNLAVWTLGGVQGWLFRHESVRTVFYPSGFVRRYLEQTILQSRGLVGPYDAEENRTQREKLELLQRGVDTVLFNPSKRSEKLRKALAPDGEIILLCVARLAPEKGFGFLAEAVKRLNSLQEGPRFTMYIVGGNKSPEVEQEIRSLFDFDSSRSSSFSSAHFEVPARTTTRVNVNDRVVFAGFETGEELATSYASADIFLHCSITETFGLVVLESMASGVPVIARDEGGPSDIVRHGESGYLVPPNDLDLFVEKVVSLARDIQLRNKLSIGARKQAEEMSWDRVNNKVAWRMGRVIRDWEIGQERLRECGREDHGNGREADLETGLFVDAQHSRDRGCVAARGVLGNWGLWTALNESVQAALVDVRLVGGMTTISAAWVAVGGYLAFIKISMWFKNLGSFWR